MYQSAGNYDALLPPPLPEVEEAGLAAYGPQPELLPVDAYVQAAEAAHPELEVRSMRMPHQPSDPVYLDGQAGNPFTRDRADKVHLHPFTAEVLGIQRTGDLGAVPFVTDAVNPLHFGYFGGLWTKVLWCVLGLVLSFAILAGTYLWAVRSGPATSSPRVAGRRTSVWLRGAPVAFAVTLAYFVVAAFSTVRGIRDYSPSQTSIPVAQAVAGPYEVQVDCEAPCLVQEGAAFTAWFLGEGLPNYRTATLGPAAETGAELEGPARAPMATFTAIPGAPLRLRITTRDDALHEATFPAPAASDVAPPQPSLPDAAPGVWWAVGIFATLTTGAVAGWFYLVLRTSLAARAARSPADASRRRGRPRHRDAAASEQTLAGSGNG